MSETPATKADIVSSESEALILVDSSDREVGFLDKSAAHDGDGVLHRAFSTPMDRDAEVVINTKAGETMATVLKKVKKMMAE